MASMSRMTTEDIKDAITEIPLVAQRENWVFTLDKDEGTFFYSPKQIDRNARLYQVTDEYAVYFNGKGRPCGVMIEYWLDNYIEHHKEIKRLSKELFVGRNETIVINPTAVKTRQSAKKFKVVFESLLVAEAVQGKHCPS